MCRGRISNHTDFYSLHANIAHHGGDLVNDHLRWHHMHRIDTQRVLRSDGRNRGHRVPAEHGYRLDIRLNTSAAAAVGPSDDQYARGCVLRHQAAAALTASHMPSTSRSTCSASSPSAITRMTGSVPDGRMTSLPVPANSASASAITC